MLKRYWRWVIVFGALASFFYLKFSSLAFRFGDGNAYIYMADAILKGLVPYRDFFVADPPVFPYFLALLKVFISEYLLLFYLIPPILEIATAYIIYRILFERGVALAFLAPLFYLFSFTILATSDFLTGLQLVNLFIVVALLCYDRKKPLISGIFWALAVLTKFYAAPALIGFLIYIYQKKEFPHLKKVLMGGLATTMVIVTPFIFVAGGNLIKYSIIHQLNRPDGVSKLDVFSFFLKMEWLLVIFGLIGGWLMKKSAYIYPLVLLVIFLSLFNDVYYLYLGVLMPYLIILLIYYLNAVYIKISKTKKLLYLSLVFYAIFMISMVNEYFKNFIILGRFRNLYEIADYVKTLPKDKKLYGSHEVAPLVALAADRELLNNYIDTNNQAFGSGANDLEKTSMAVIDSESYLIGRISHYPDYGVKDLGTEGYFLPEYFKKYCVRVKDFKSTSREQDNQIVIYQCKKN